jgi:hypothetical protein
VVRIADHCLTGYYTAIHESADDLKDRLLQERDARQRQRLHMLYLLADVARWRLGWCLPCGRSFVGSGAGGL